MNAGDAYIRVQFPDGAVFLVRTEISGVVFDETAKPVDEELAADMLLIKGLNLTRRQSAGRA